MLVAASIDITTILILYGIGGQMSGREIPPLAE